MRSHIVKSLSSNAALEILGDRGLIASESTLKKLIIRCEGNPLILKILSSSIETLFQGNVQIFLECNHILYGNIWQLIDQQFQRLSNLEQQVINYLVLEDRSVSKLLNSHQLQISPCQIMEALESLQGRS